MSNKYLHIYNALIYKRKYIEILKKSKDHYGEYENHHIIPRACNGSNNKSNIVCLTIREHYIAHLLLAFIYKGTIYESRMLKAISYMKFGGSTSMRRKFSRFNSHLYEQLAMKGRKTGNRLHSIKGYVHITNGVLNKMIHPNKLSHYLENGWRRGQSQKISSITRKRRGYKFKNTYFVTNGICNLRIPNDQKIPAGFVKGRTFNCSHLSKNPTATRHKWMNKNGSLIHISESQIQKYIDMGYQLGRNDANAFKFATKGKIAITNGHKTKMIFPSELAYWEELGWKKGSARRYLRHK